MTAMNQNFKVYARIRPIDYQQKIIDIRDETSIHIKEITKIGQESGEIQSYTFAQVFNQMSAQEDIFEVMKNQCLGPVLDGQNVCILAYGQTFSGKSYTIFGEDEQYTPGNYFSTDNIDKRGLVPRTIEYFIKKSQELEETKSFNIQCSLYEIYLDRIRDLGKAYSEKHCYYLILKIINFLANPALVGKVSSQNMPMNFENENLDLTENPNGQITIKNLMSFSITNMSDLYEMLKAAFKLRSKYETQNNQLSARSHSVKIIQFYRNMQVFTLNVIQKDKENENLPFINAMIQFVDLAGSGLKNLLFCIMVIQKELPKIQQKE